LQKIPGKDLKEECKITTLLRRAALQDKLTRGQEKKEYLFRSELEEKVKY